MRRRLLCFLGSCLLLALSGCVSGPKYDEIERSIPPLDPKQGRIFFYRPAVYTGAGIQPAILLNGETVGDSKPGGFFFVDAAPGTYSVTISTEVDRRISFALRAGQTRYVRTQVTMGVMVGHVTPELIEEESARASLGDLAYTGGALTASRAAATRPPAAAALPVTVAPAASGTSSRAASAGNSRLPSPGDTWRYRQTKVGQGGGREHVVQVRSSGGGKIVDEVTIAGQAPVETDHTSGAYLINQGVSLFSPYLNVLGPMGSSRVVPSRDPFACPVDVVCTINSSLTGHERIKLPAGEFDTRKVRLEHSWQYHRYGSGRREVMLWYADDAKRVVKVRSRTLGGGHVNIETDYDLELIEYHLK